MGVVSLAGAVVILTILLAVFIIFVMIKVTKLQKKQAFIELNLKAAELASSELQSTQTVLEKQIADLITKLQHKTDEDIQISKQIEHRVQSVRSDIENINSRLTQLQELQPQDKLYSRAYKLAALGADIDEIMTECELPRAEVEMLLSVYQQQES